MKASQFKNLIKEVFREVLREEYPLLMEQYQPHLINKVIKEDNNYSDINSPRKPLPKPTGNPLIDILNETRTGMTGDDWNNVGNFNTNNMNGFSGHINRNEPIVGNTNDMLNNASKSSHLEQIEINTVPDYSKLMGTMKEQGKI